MHVLILVIYICRSLYGVGSGLGNRVDTTADEIRLTDIKRRHDNLNLLDGIKRNRISTTGKRSTETKVVVHIGTVNGEVRGTT